MIPDGGGDKRVREEDVAVVLTESRIWWEPGICAYADMHAPHLNFYSGYSRSHFQAMHKLCSYVGFGKAGIE